MSPNDRRFALAAFVVALLPRLLVAFLLADGPVWDGWQYHEGAKRIAAGLGYTEVVVLGGEEVTRVACHYPVGYPAFLAPFYAVFGGTVRVGACANALVGALLAVVTFLLARLALTPTRARIAAMMVALWPGLVLYTGALMTEPLTALGLALAAWVALADRFSARSALVAGALLGLTALVRPASLIFVPVLALVAWPSRPTVVRFGVLSIVAALVTIAPWTRRNCRELDGCALVSTNGGWNLAIGAFPRATGRYEPLRPASDGCPMEHEQVAQDRCWTRAALRWASDDPIRWVRLTTKKLHHTFDHASTPVGYLADARPAAWPDARLRPVRGLLTGSFRILLALAALACVPRGATLRLLIVASALAASFAVRPHAAWPLALLAIAFALRPEPRLDGPVFRASGLLLGALVVTVVVFFGEDRYHLVVAPFLAVLAASALRRPC